MFMRMVQLHKRIDLIYTHNLQKFHDLRHKFLITLYLIVSIHNLLSHNK
jgi:hypothetical protein